MRHTVCETKDQNPSTYDSIPIKQANKLKTVTNCFQNMILILFEHHLVSLYFC